MNRAHALRFLLLRHIKRYESSVSGVDFQELTRSLTVSEDAAGFQIAWERKGQPVSRPVPQSAFSFYVRGDTDPESRTRDDALDRGNESLAESLAMEALGTAKPAAIGPLPPLNAPGILQWIESFGFVTALMMVKGITAGTGLFLLAIVLVEYARKGRILVSILLFPLAVIHPGALLFGATAYAIFNYLDPNAEWRKTRVAINLCTVLVAIQGLFTQGVSPGIVAIIGWPLAGAAIVVFRSLVGTHFRAMPMVFPCLAAGFAFEGNDRAAACGLLFCLVLFVFYHHRKLRPRRAHSKACT